MTQIKVDNVVDAAGTAATDFTSGLTVAGAALSTLNTAEYYETGTEPASPKNGAIWKDTANDKVMVYIADEFKEVELGAAAGAASWTVDISQLSYDSVSFSVVSQEATARQIRFNTDGTKMYLGGSNDNIYQYSLSTAFDISTLSYDNIAWNPGSVTDIQAFFFNSDGTKIYIGASILYEYSLSTAFDMSSTLTLVSSSLDLGENSFCWNISRDGTKVFACPFSDQDVHSWSLSTPYDTSSASKDTYVLADTNNQRGFPTDINFDSSGGKLYLLDDNSNVYQYSMTTAYDLSTATYDSKSFNFSSTDTSTQSLVFNADGTKALMSAKIGDAIYQYSTGL